MLIGRLQVPPNVRKGEAFEVRVLVQHPMETGFRRDMNGRAIRSTFSTRFHAATPAARSSAPSSARDVRRIPISRSS
jgi:hypothetical protein